MGNVKKVCLKCGCKKVASAFGKNQNWCRACYQKYYQEKKIVFRLRASRYEIKQSLLTAKGAGKFVLLDAILFLDKKIKSYRDKRKK